MAARNTPPYWLAEGTERCEICTHAYVLEMGYRCVACDHGVCEHCMVVVRARHEVFCRPCHAEEEGT